MASVALVGATRVIPASAADIFELLATPAQHAVIDGSGTVRDVQPGTPRRLSAGSRFGMQMHWGAPYKILNQVVEFEEGRLISWRHFAGHVWRYRLEPMGPNSTRVTEEFDPAGSRASLVLWLMGASRRNQRSIEETLARLDTWARSH